MLLWRISDFASLDGKGGLFSHGRWHHKGTPVVYTAEGSPLAILESLVRIGRIRLPPPFQLLRIEVVGKVAVARFEADIVPPLDKSRNWGTAWLNGGTTALASVPSAVAPFARNILINPAHADAAKAKVTEASSWPWDQRLFVDT